MHAQKNREVGRGCAPWFGTPIPVTEFAATGLKLVPFAVVVN